MNFAQRYLDTDCGSYEEMQQRLKLRIPENFNFAFDIVDEYARLCPEKRALVWCNDKGEEKQFSFGEISLLSKKLADSLYKMGIRKGDFVMLIMKRRAEYWITYPALHRLGAVAIPATHMLTKKDVVYRNNIIQTRLSFSVHRYTSPNAAHKAVSGFMRGAFITPRP